MKGRYVTKGIVLILLIYLPSQAFTVAQERSSFSGDSSFSSHSIEEPPVIDGYLDEKNWKGAEVVSDFRQFEPTEGAPASQKTEVRVLYGEGNVYVAAVLHDDNPAGIRRVLTRRDDYNQADWFLVSIDSYYNHKTAYTFGVNAAGVQFDALQRDNSRNDSWDAVWESAVQITDHGWNVELRIPYSMLRFPEEDTQTWGVRFVRRIPRLGEQSEWPLIPRTERSNFVANYGRMTGISEIEPRPNLQVRPYSVARLRTREDEKKPGTMAASRSMDVGGDVKVGLGPNVTLDATVNPDFGQVESDPAVLNLTAFETFFDEKRPFFVEGQQYYDFDITVGNMFYSRRIGSHDPVIGATKLSGRTDGDLSFGVLGAATGSQGVPSRGYGVARVNQQINNYSSAGGILTTFQGPGVEGRGLNRSLSGGADWDLRFDENQYGFAGFGTFTHQRWTEEERSSKTGYAGKVEFEKREGVWRARGNVKVIGDKFDANNIGRITRDVTDFMETYWTFDYEINRGRPFGYFRRADVDASVGITYTEEDKISKRQFFDVGSNWRTNDFEDISVDVRINNIFDSYDLYETRGLWPWNKPYDINVSGSYQTDDRRSWSINTGADYSFYENGGSEYSASIGGDWDASNRISLSGSINGEWERSYISWSSNESFVNENGDWKIGSESMPPDDLDEDDFVDFSDEGVLDNILEAAPPYSEGSYYVPVFGERDTRSLDFTLRSTVAFTPTLSLQLYSQFFLANGSYDNFKILVDRDNLEPFSSYPKKRYLNIDSFQSNIVFRWRFRPGSTIYLVWDHSRREDLERNSLAGSDPVRDAPSFMNQVGDAFDIFPSNSFIFKVEYNISYY